MCRKNSLIIFIILLITIFTGQLAKANFIDTKLIEIKSIEDFSDFEIKFDRIFGVEDEGDFYKYKDEYVDELEKVDFIAIVTPTGNVQQKGYNFRQEVIVEDVINGDKGLVNKKTYLENINGIVNDNIDGRGLDLYYVGIKNVMQNDHKYIAFFNNILLNEYSEEYSLHQLSGVFSYLKLDEDINTKIIESIDNIYQYNELLDYEFFTTSKSVLEELYNIKSEIILRYYK